MKKLILNLLILVIITGVVCIGLKPDSFDYVIKNGKIVDGTGNPWYRADIGIKGGKIVKIGIVTEKNAKEVIDATDRVVSPGFMDIHTHTDGAAEDGTVHNYIMQGVTTVISGNCGGSEIDVKKFLNKLEKQGIALNYGTLVGQGSVRDTVMGNEDREPTDAEMERMKWFVEKAMKEGAVGLSTGLEYTPGTYSKTDEITELCKVVAKYGGFYATHMRDESEKVIEAIEEAVEIGEKADLPVEVSHFKVFGVNNWGRSIATIKMVNDARERGVDITVDQYPYPAASTGLGIMYPTWALEGDDWKARLKDEELRAKIKKE
ncbi:MAG: amidohydrolase family protein, partial [Candidatus Heimdallarchaeota archaeon]|nr:amidohydrolase family protein [Candidatus Heimdallarchaeota archaeon]